MKKFYCLITFLCIAYNSISQPTINDFSFIVETTQADSVFDQALVDIKYIISIPSAINLSKVQISMGRTPGGSDKFNYVFYGENVSDFPMIQHYSLINGVINYTLHEYPLQNYYYSVRIEDADGNSSITKTYP